MSWKEINVCWIVLMKTGNELLVRFIPTSVYIVIMRAELLLCIFVPRITSGYRVKNYRQLICFNPSPLVVYAYRSKAVVTKKWQFRPLRI